MKPSTPITDPRFVYRDSAQTDLHATFARVRRERQEAEAAAQKAEEDRQRELAEHHAKVNSIYALRRAAKP